MMKCLLLSIARLLVTVAGVIVAAQTAWAEATVSFPTTSGGSGTIGDPYKISSTDDLDQLAADVNSGTYYQGVYFSDNVVNVADIVKAINDGLSLDDINEMVNIIMKE